MTLGSSRIRRAPNCFNLVHQLEFLARGGLSQAEVEKTLQAGRWAVFQHQQIGNPCAEHRLKRAWPTLQVPTRWAKLKALPR